MGLPENKSQSESGCNMSKTHRHFVGVFRKSFLTFCAFSGDGCHMNAKPQSVSCHWLCSWPSFHLRILQTPARSPSWQLDVIDDGSKSQKTISKQAFMMGWCVIGTSRLWSNCFSDIFVIQNKQILMEIQQILTSPLYKKWAKGKKRNSPNMVHTPTWLNH